MNHLTFSFASAVSNSRACPRRAKLLSSASSTNGFDQSDLIRRTSAMTFSTGFTLYPGVSRIELAQKVHLCGHPREVCTVTRLYLE